MPQGVDPPVQLLKSSLTVFLGQRVDYVVDLGRASRQRTNQSKPRRQLAPRIYIQQLATTGDLVFQLAHSHNVRALSKSTDQRCFQRERVERVGNSLDDVWTKQLVVGQFDRALLDGDQMAREIAAIHRGDILR